MCNADNYKCTVHPNNNAVPCAFLILRDGKPLTVCTHCLVVGRGDKIIAMLYDKHTSLKEFFEYDMLGTMMMMSHISLEGDEETLGDTYQSFVD